MTNSEIFVKVLNKVHNTYDMPISIQYKIMTFTCFTHGSLENQELAFMSVPIETIIFSHEFAKAFWGEQMTNDEMLINEYNDIRWKYHLQQMVLEKEPLKYLEKFL